MISLDKIIDQINNLLNENANGYKYSIYSDAELHHKPRREENDIVIEGIATLINSSVVPVSELKIGTQTISVELTIPIDTRDMEDESVGIQDIVKNYKQDIDSLVSSPQNITIENYVCTFIGTLAEVGEVQQSSSIGVSIPISFTISLNYFVDGVNSLNEKLFFEEAEQSEEIKYTSMSFGRTVIQDGGAFSSDISNNFGVAKNYVQTTALSIELVMPALTNSNFCSKFFNFLLYGTNNKFRVRLCRYNADGTNYGRAYDVIFLSSNEQAQGVDNVGYTITLAEAL